MSGTDRPIDLTAERYNRFAAALESLFEHQKSLARLVAAGQRDALDMSRRVEERLSAVETRLFSVEREVKETRIELVSQMNEILTAQQTALRADMRLDRMEQAARIPEA